MAGTTANRSYPYPSSGDTPNIHTDIQGLATAIDTDVNTNLAPKASPTFTGTTTIPVIKWGVTTTATAGGTTTLTSSSTFQQYFTGTLNQTVTLPVTSTLAVGVSYEINNNSTGTITINSSGGNLVLTVPSLSSAALTCIGTTLTTAADWEAEWNGAASYTGTGSVVLSASPTFTGTPLSTTAAVDTNTTQIATTAYVVGQGYSKLASPTFTGSVTIPAIKWGYTTTATAAGTTTLTVSSTYFQVFTGTTTQTVTMPVTSTLTVGHTFKINNNSTGNLTVNSSGANLIVTVLPNTTVTLTCVGTTLTTAADWDAEFDGYHSNTGTGSVVLATSPTLVTPALGTPASGTLTNCTGLPIAGTTGWGTGVATLLAAAATGSTSLVGSNTPTISTATLSGTTTISGPQFMTGGVTYFYQPAITTNSTTGAQTLTIANLLTEIINYTGAGITTMTLPTGTLMDGGITGIVNNVAFEWTIVNTTANIITMAGGTGNTYVGNTSVAANVSARFRSVRTATTTWSTYRVA